MKSLKPSRIYGIIITSIKEAINWKFDMALTVLIAPLSLLVYWYLWGSIFAYSGKPTIGGMTFIQLMTYFLLTWVIGVATYNSVDDNLAHNIRKGNIGRLLIRPFNYLLFNFFSAIGDRFIALFVEIAPIVVIGLLFRIAINKAYLPLFAISVFLAMCLSFLLSCIFGLSAFWLVKSHGVLRIKRILNGFLSGGLIPLSFFPLWFQKFSYYMPFQFMTFIPINIWLAKYSIGTSLLMILLQLVWVAVLFGVASFIWWRAMRKVSAVGI